MFFLLFRGMGLRVFSLSLIFILTLQVIHFEQKWHVLPQHTIVEEAQGRLNTLNTLRQFRPFTNPYESPLNKVSRLALKPFNALIQLTYSIMGLTNDQVKKLPLSTIPTQLEGIFLAQDPAVSHCLLNKEGVTLRLYVGDQVQPNVVITQIVKEGIVLKEQRQFTFLPYRKIY